MQKRKSLYLASLEHAVHTGEINAWRENNQENQRCAQEIQTAIAANFDGYRLKQGLCDAVIQTYGLDRVKYVIASTVQSFDHDGRITRDNKAWAKQFPIADKEPDRRSYLINSSTGLLDIFLREVRHTEAKLLDAANQVIEDGRTNTSSGVYITTFEEAAEGILPPEQVEFFKEEIGAIMARSEAVSDIDLADEGGFDVNYYVEYVPNYEPMQEEIEEYGEGWPKQESLLPLTLADLNASLISGSAKDTLASPGKEDTGKPSLLGQLKDYQAQTEQTPGKEKFAANRHNEREV